MKTTFLTFCTLILFIITSLAAGGGINGGNPVPYIDANAQSAEFISLCLKLDYGGEQKDWLQYATSVTKTLSQLSAAEQSDIWYGGDSGGGGGDDDDDGGGDDDDD